MTIETQSRRAFSLVELLVVGAIIAVLLGLAAAGISGFTRNYDYTKSISQITSYLEIARAESMSKNMWTWVGMKQTTQGSTPVLLLLAVGSKSGAADRTPANLYQVAKVARFPNVDLRKLDSSLPNILDGSDFPFSWNISGDTVSFSEAVFAISPQGEVFIKEDNISPWVEVGVAQTRNGETNPSQTCSILVSGVSGQIIVSRP